MGIRSDRGVGLRPAATGGLARLLAWLASTSWGVVGIAGEPVSSSPSQLPPAGFRTVAVPSESAVGPSLGKGGERLREGTRLVDVIGTFQTLGADGVTFSPRGSKDSYRVLENLALERIGRALDETRGVRWWVVSGLITEYRGANYLLVTKAVMQPDEPSPTP